MKILLAFIFTTLFMAQQLSYDFGSSCDNCDQWFVVVDGVMGGLSQGTVLQSQESIIFRGRISLENNGGFASLRTPYQDYDLSAYKTVTVRYRSTGQDFGLTLSKHRQFWRPQYKTNLPTTNGTWKTLTCNLEDFETYRLGELMPGTPDKEDLSGIIRLGLISNTEAASDFEIEVDKIYFE